uniref:DUF6818 domain-containing protein n=2 Tax=Phytophthora fragariae TaxID=53985 RepID=A0A6A3DWG4_9STRA|nr:hypothetical protein PF009_g27678 [Phytophthora fragariae]
MTKAAKTKTKGKNFTKSEITRMLDVVEAIIPFGAEQWQNAASQFNTNIPAGWTERDGDSLKRKFQKLVRVPKPTGKKYMEVQRAKRLQYAIEASLAVVQLHDNFSDEEFEEGDPDHGTMNADVEAANTVPMTASSPLSPVADSQLAQTPPATLSRPADPSTPLQATPRAGLEPSELAELSASLGKHSAASAAVSLSQTARRCIKLDRIINTVNNDIQASQNASDPSQSMMAMLMAMEERQQARDAQYRHERDTDNQHMMMMLLVRLVESRGGAESGGEQH